MCFINFSVKLSNVESLAMMMETRLVQLETAILMELWQEAYKSAEDLHTVMQLTKDKDKKIVRPTNYANYYDKVHSAITGLDIILYGLGKFNRLLSYFGKEITHFFMLRLCCRNLIFTRI